MGFYYGSLFSMLLLSFVYVLLGFTFWGIARGTRGVRGRAVLLAVMGAVLLIAPISEELWIAWNFGQACKEAGTFIYKKVQADGFYDDTRTTHAGPPTPEAVKALDRLGYRFLEMKGREKFVRVEKVDAEWRARILDTPTARYQYTGANEIPVVHKVVKHEYKLIDMATKEVLARELEYGRDAPWFFVGLDAPRKSCAGQRDVKGFLYQSVLLPAGH